MENVDPFGTFYLQHSIFIDSEWTRPQDLLNLLVSTRYVMKQYVVAVQCILIKLKDQLGNQFSSEMEYWLLVLTEIRVNPVQLTLW